MGFRISNTTTFLRQDEIRRIHPSPAPSPSRSSPAAKSLPETPGVNAWVRGCILGQYTRYSKEQHDAAAVAGLSTLVHSRRFQTLNKETIEVEALHRMDKAYADYENATGHPMDGTFARILGETIGSNGFWEVNPTVRDRIMQDFHTYAVANKLTAVQALKSLVNSERFMTVNIQRMELVKLDDLKDGLTFYTQELPLDVTEGFSKFILSQGFEDVDGDVRLGCIRLYFELGNSNTDRDRVYRFVNHPGFKGLDKAAYKKEAIGLMSSFVMGHDLTDSQFDAITRRLVSEDFWKKGFFESDDEAMTKRSNWVADYVNKAEEATRTGQPDPIIVV